MNLIRKNLEKLRIIKRKKYHPLIHKIHKKHKISKRTLFYIKEYGPQANIPKTIIKESIKILLLASIISSFGGLAMESIKTILISITPMIILLPTLNDMIGDYGVIVSSRFSTMIHEGKIKGKLFSNKELKKLFLHIFITSLIMAFLSAIFALVISNFFNGFNSIVLSLKIIFVVLLDVILIVNILFFSSIIIGRHIYKKGEDPNNFLIPITTSIADFGNMIILSILIIIIF